MKRLTRQRTEILRVIDEAQRPLSPQEILEAGRAAIPSLSIATIYRNLRDLQQDGMIQAVALPGDSPRYESRRAHAHHHHHFQCSKCQLAQEHMTMLVVTHEMAFAREVAHRVCFMDKGKIVEERAARAFFEDPHHERARAFLEHVL